VKDSLSPVSIIYHRVTYYTLIQCAPLYHGAFLFRRKNKSVNYQIVKIGVEFAPNMSMYSQTRQHRALNVRQLMLLGIKLLTFVLTVSPASIALAELPGTVSAELFSFSVPLSQSGSGSMTVIADIGDVESEFLLDTGASMVTVSRELFEQVRDQAGTIKVRQVGARLASGKLQLMDVYEVQHFSLGDNCDLGPLEIAVLERGGRNLLGMNALQSAAPFAVFTFPPALAISNCQTH
jgi:predicted aspartyl protease